MFVQQHVQRKGRLPVLLLKRCVLWLTKKFPLPNSGNLLKCNSCFIPCQERSKPPIRMPELSFSDLRNSKIKFHKRLDAFILKRHLFWLFRRAHARGTIFQYSASRTIFRDLPAAFFAESKGSMEIKRLGFRLREGGRGEPRPLPAAPNRVTSSVALWPSTLSVSGSVYTSGGRLSSRRQGGSQGPAKRVFSPQEISFPCHLPFRA